MIFAWHAGAQLVRMPPAAAAGLQRLILDYSLFAGACLTRADHRL